MRRLLTIGVLIGGLLQAGCIQRVNEEAERLDERFLTSAVRGGANVPVSPSEPFPEYDGEWVTLSGVLKAEHDGPIELDVVSPSQRAGEDRPDAHTKACLCASERQWKSITRLSTA